MGHPVSVVCRRIDASDWAQLVERLTQEDPGWTESTKLFVSYEALTECVLKQGTLMEEPPSDAWEGRLFDDRADVRWLRREDERFVAWLTYEGLGGKPMCRSNEPRRYYLIGERRGEGFEEGRYPGRVFRHPVDAAVGERAYVKVYEYGTPEPAWASLEATQIESELNASRVVAHRFAGLGSGKEIS